MVGARNLEAAAIPHLQALQPEGPPGPAGAAAIAQGVRGQGASVVLDYDGAESSGYRADASSAPSLPQETVHAEWLDRPVTCHVAAERERFNVSPSTVESGVPPTDATESARQYIASLIQLGRIDAGSAASMVRGPVAGDRPERHTHKLEESADGRLLLTRIQFQCLPRL